MVKVTNNVTNNHKIRPPLSAKVCPADGVESKGMANSERKEGFLHFESCSLDARLLVTVCRALVLTGIATPHAGREMGARLASSSRLSLEHNVGYVTSGECSVSLFVRRRQMRV